MTLDQLLDLPETQLAWQLMAALEAVDHEYEPWARLIGMTPGTRQADEAYEVTHAAYAASWSRMGDMFHVKLWPLADEWRVAARHTARGQLANRLTRAFARVS